MPILVNLGCGDRTHPDWVNIDFSLRNRLRRVPLLARLLGGPLPPGYRNHDLRHGVPYRSESVDVVYSSHVLEHLHPDAVPGALQEMRRVLKPGGFLRIVVPDLESVARAYIAALDAVRTCAEQARPENVRLGYEWSVIWLLDQCVRTRTGGMMTRWLRRHRSTQFVHGLGGVMTEVARSRGAEELRPPASWVRALAERRDARSTGELHLWMYDSYSLTTLVSAAGFREVSLENHDSSRIDRWRDYGLDTNADGGPHQPGSLWLEATK